MSRPFGGFLMVVGALLLVSGPLRADYNNMQTDGRWFLWLGQDDTVQGSGLALMQHSALQRSQDELQEQLHTPPLFSAITLHRASLLALRPDGSVYGFGVNASGMLGQEVFEHRLIPNVFNPFTYAHRPWVASIRLVHGILGARQLAMGGAHSLAVLDDGALCAWGANDVGQLGAAPRSSSDLRLIPWRVGGLSSMRLAAAGDAHSLALDTQGRLWSWGLNNMGQLGDGSQRNRFQPRVIAQTGPYVALAAGAGHSLALDDQGRVWSWGDNNRGQLGRFTGKLPFSRKPALVQGLASAVTKIGAAGDVSVALGRDGSVWWWGGHLGRNVAARSEPWQLNRLEGIGSVQDIVVFAEGMAVTDAKQRVWVFTEPYDQPPRQLGGLSQENQQTVPPPVIETP